MPGEPTEGSMHLEDRSNVDERKYENMEVVAAAGGVEAEARRLEMARWSERQGALAEQAAEMQASIEERGLRSGKTAERIADEVVRNTVMNAEQGTYMGPNTEYDGNLLKASKSGIQETRVQDGESSEYRSPTHVRGEQEKSESGSPETSQEA